MPYSPIQSGESGAAIRQKLNNHGAQVDQALSQKETAGAAASAIASAAVDASNKANAALTSANSFTTAQIAAIPSVNLVPLTANGIMLVGPNGAPFLATLGTGLSLVNGALVASGGGSTPSPSSGITVVASTVAAPGVNGGATAAQDTTGANLLVASISWYLPGGAVTLTDSKGNTWTALTVYSHTDPATRLFYCASPTVGTGHTFTAVGAGTYPVISVLAVSGANATPFEEESGNTNIPSTQPGTVTPDANGSLIVTSLGVMSSATPPTATGFTNLTLADGSGVNIAGGMSYLIQATASAVNPEWSTPGAAAAAVFKPV